MTEPFYALARLLNERRRHWSIVEAVVSTDRIRSRPRCTAGAGRIAGGHATVEPHVLTPARGT